MAPIIVCFLMVVLSVGATTGVESTTDPHVLLGTWRVDLRSTPDAEAYYQELVVTKLEGNTFQRSFYGSEIENAHINVDWSEVYFAFTTRDNSGAYNSSGVVSGKQPRGTTHSLTRGFLSDWTAERSK